MSKIINVSNSNSTSMYHTKEYKSSRTEQNVNISVYEVTGYTPKGDIQVEDILYFSQQEQAKVLEILEQRDHKGVFTPPPVSRERILQSNGRISQSY